MARAYVGPPANKTWTLVRDDGEEVEMPCCNVCGLKMQDVNLPQLVRYTAGREHPDKYPWKEPVFVCEPCRVRWRMDGDRYLMVPWPEGVSVRAAVRQFLIDVGGAIDALGILAEET